MALGELGLEGETLPLRGQMADIPQGEGSECHAGRKRGGKRGLASRLTDETSQQR
jgi:hypothetical protein